MIVSAFEDARIDDETYDLIYAASAFHWVDPAVGCPKAYRLLKNGGTFALFRNNAISSDGGLLGDKIRAAYDKYYYGYYQPKPRPGKKTRAYYGTPSGILSGYGFENISAYGFGDVMMKFYDASIVYDADG